MKIRSERPKENTGLAFPLQVLCQGGFPTVLSTFLVIWGENPEDFGIYKENAQRMA